MLKKENRVNIFTRVDRANFRIIDFQASRNRDFVAVEMVMRLEKYDITYLCSDDYDVYKKYKISKEHVVSKSETLCLVEAKNSSPRDNLARLNRRTKRYSKSLEVLSSTSLGYALTFSL